MFPTSIPKEKIQHLPLTRFDGEIVVVDDTKQLPEVISHCRKQTCMGFDTEKKPTFQRGQYHPTALVQLSTLDTAYLIRVNKIGFPPSLVSLMADPNLIKVGISIMDDIKALQKIKDFHPAGFLELNDVAGEVGVEDRGVKKLAGIFLEARISKNQQTSNWENEALTPSQQLYAATDAWVCMEIYDCLQRKGYLD